ncbi:MAG TPA: hypothetical protein VKP58_17375, partial [Candidatus Acidoferrum sp.]|nr:hypothetical protein [Candidatus Acidoferrum sp.]
THGLGHRFAFTERDAARQPRHSPFPAPLPKRAAFGSAGFRSGTASAGWTDCPPPSVVWT